jgi:hypothetical protein
VVHEERSRAMQGLHIGLFDRLDRHKAHGGSTHRCADRFRIAPIILVGLDVGLDILRCISLTVCPSCSHARPQCCALPHASLPITQAGRFATVSNTC